MKLIIPLLLLSASLSAQRIYATLGPGMTNKYLSAELNVGVFVKNITLSGGYIIIINNGQPALFNSRIGYTIKERVHVYAGHVWVHKSDYWKAWNYKTWSVGAAYHFWHYDDGTFYVNGNYSPKFVTVGAGMTVNLFQD